MKDLLATTAFARQDAFLETHGDRVWEDITDAYDLGEPIGDKRLPSLAFCTSPEQNRRYQQVVCKNVAAQHALADTGEPQVRKLGRSWVLCDPAAEKGNWPDIRAHALRFARVE
jgi:hypothetical protein